VNKGRPWARRTPPAYNMSQVTSLDPEAYLYLQRYDTALGLWLPVPDTAVSTAAVSELYEFMMGEFEKDSGSYRIAEVTVQVLTGVSAGEH
jgi:hypothetical protein